MATRTNRLLPWRSKPSALLAERIERAKSSRLYLIKERGPTSFVVRGSDDSISKNFSVLIGERQSCSCTDMRSVTYELCVHIIFVMQKVLGVPADNPLSWQRSLLDSEVDDILRIAEQKNRSVCEATTSTAHETGAIQPAACDHVEQRQISVDDSCPICQEVLNETTQPLVYCRKGCGNSCHAQCHQVWAQYRIQVGESVTCPFCRGLWEDSEGSNCTGGVAAIARRRVRGGPHFAVHEGYRCGKCKRQPLVGSRYRCVLCDAFDLCETCWISQSVPHSLSHQSRNCFVKRDQPLDPSTLIDTAGYKVAHLPRSRVSTFNPSSKSKDAIRELQYRDLSSNDYDILLSLDNNRNGRMPRQDLLHDHLTASLMLVSPTHNSGQDTMADAEGINLCSLCNSCLTKPPNIADSDIRLLPCGHKVHNTCIRDALVYNTRMRCPKDNTAVHKGICDDVPQIFRRKSSKPKVVDIDQPEVSSSLTDAALEVSPFAIVGIPCAAPGAPPTANVFPNHKRTSNRRIIRAQRHSTKSSTASAVPECADHGLWLGNLSKRQAPKHGRRAIIGNRRSTGLIEFNRDRPYADWKGLSTTGTSILEHSTASVAHHQ